MYMYDNATLLYIYIYIWNKNANVQNDRNQSLNFEPESTDLIGKSLNFAQTRYLQN